MQSLFGRKLRVEPLERRTLLASNVLDTSAELTDFSSGHVYISGVIESSETRDVFKVSLGSNPTIAIFSGNAYLNESIKLELIDGNGNTIQHLEDRSSPAHYYFDALAKGDYFFVVTSDAVDDVEYGLTLNEYRSSVEGGTPDPETRPDDADEIGPSATELILTDGTGEMNGTLEVKGDVDVFRFTVGEFDHLDLRGLRIDGGEALTVRLFFGDGRYWNFVVDENSQVLADPRELVGSHFQHLPAGEYFVVVSSNDVQAIDYRISVTAYDLTTEHTMANVIIVDGSGENGIDVSDEVGPNASELKMTELFGDMVSAKGGTLEVEGDVDVYRFATKAYDYLTLGGSMANDISFRLVSGDGLELTATPLNTGQLLFKNILAGEYFITVRAGNVETTKYSFNIKAYNDVSNEIGPLAKELVLSAGSAESEGSFEADGDIDVYRFSIHDSDSVTVNGWRFSDQAMMQNWSMGLFMADGKEVESRAVGFEQSPTWMTFENLAPGEYFLVVSANTTGWKGFWIGVNESKNSFTAEAPLDVNNFNQIVDRNIDLELVAGDTVNVGLDESTDFHPSISDLSMHEFTVSANSSESGSSVDGENKATLAASTEMEFHNNSNPTDVNGDGKKTPADVLILVNWLNEYGVSRVAEVANMLVSTGRLTTGQSNFLDVSGNGSIEPRDAFLVVRELNRQLSNRRDAEAEGESAADQMAVNVDWIFSDRDSESEWFDVVS